MKLTRWPEFGRLQVRFGRFRVIGVANFSSSGDEHSFRALVSPSVNAAK
jgi:hypothetical protein